MGGKIRSGMVGKVKRAFGGMGGKVRSVGDEINPGRFRRGRRGSGLGDEEMLVTTYESSSL